MLCRIREIKVTEAGADIYYLPLPKRPLPSGNILSSLAGFSSMKVGPITSPEMETRPYGEP